MRKDVWDMKNALEDARNKQCVHKNILIKSIRELGQLLDPGFDWWTNIGEIICKDVNWNTLLLLSCLQREVVKRAMPVFSHVPIRELLNRFS
jgi:hypothetical protein